MATRSLPNLTDCNCLAVRQAAPYITQFYDQYLAAAGLRTTQYGVLARLKRHGPMSINTLAGELVVDDWVAWRLCPHLFLRAMLIHVFSVLCLPPLSMHRSPQIPAAARMLGINSSTCV
jgi:hypothetical protein